MAKKSGIKSTDIKVRTVGEDYPVVFEYGDIRVLTAPTVFDKSYMAGKIPKDRIVNE